MLWKLIHYLERSLQDNPKNGAKVVLREVQLIYMGM